VVTFPFAFRIGLYFRKVAGRMPLCSGLRPLARDLFATFRSTMRPANSSTVVCCNSAFDDAVELDRRGVSSCVSSDRA
jgi:hypothetical protein